MVSILHQRSGAFQRQVYSLILTLSLTHHEWHPAKEIHENNQRNVLVVLYIEILLCMFYNCLLAVCPRLQRATPQSLASVTAGSDNNPPFRILALISSSRAPKSLLHIIYSFPLCTTAHALMLLCNICTRVSPFPSIQSCQVTLALWGHLYWFMGK